MEGQEGQVHPPSLLFSDVSIMSYFGFPYLLNYEVFEELAYHIARQYDTHK